MQIVLECQQCKSRNIETEFAARVQVTFCDGAEQESRVSDRLELLWAQCSDCGSEDIQWVEVKEVQK